VENRRADLPLEAAARVGGHPRLEEVFERRLA
jgi:hypothetical protein